MGPIVPTMSLPISTTTFIVDRPEPPLAAAIAVGPDGALWFRGRMDRSSDDGRRYLILRRSRAGASRSLHRGGAG
jgi:hypothetical protein